MPQLPPDEESSSDDGLAGWAEDVRRSTWEFWDGFIDFALRDNVLEVAVGLIFAASFTELSKSLVSDIILPLISLLPFLSRNLEECFVILRKGQKYARKIIPRYNTIQQGLDDGAVIWAYGNFLDKILRFFVVALSLFLIAKIYEKVTHDKVVKRQVRCKYCRKWVSERARRCVNCTSWLDGREDK